MFGPSALATPANAVTFARLLAALPLCVLVLVAAPSYWLTAVWIVLATTDGVDGYLARRHGTTRSGAFLDPLADKALVLGALWALVVSGAFWWLPVALITVRELAISLFRSYWGRRGLAVPASRAAKTKTVVQAVAIGLALLPLSAENAPWLGSVVLWAAVALTLVSGAQYLIEGSRATFTGGARSRR